MGALISFAFGVAVGTVAGPWIKARFLAWQAKKAAERLGQ